MYAAIPPSVKFSRSASSVPYGAGKKEGRKVGKKEDGCHDTFSASLPLTASRVLLNDSTRREVHVLSPSRLPNDDPKQPFFRPI